MKNSPRRPAENFTLDGIEVVDLWEVDLDFAVEEAFRESASTLETSRSEPADPEDLFTLDLFHGVDANDVAALAAQCLSIHAVPGYVLLAPGRLNTKIFFVIEGQLRLYAQSGNKRPMAVADVGQSTGLRSSLSGQPADHAVIATEVSHFLALDVAALEQLSKRSHAFTRNYAALLASYLRGDNCFHVDKPTPGAAARQGYIDELTLVHNQHWLDTVFPRLLSRYRVDNKKLSVAAFAIDKLEDIIKQHGIGVGLRVLETLGRWLLEQTRPTDILAINKNRHFFAFLPDYDLDGARQLASRLKALIQSVPIPLAASAAPVPVNVTLAFGIAEFESGMNEDEFLNKTEALIQKSVKLGGNWLSDSLENP